MRPINLIPKEIKRRRMRRDTGLAPYILTGLLALVVAGVLGFVLMKNQVTSNKNRVTEVSAKVKQAESEAASLSDYGKFAVIKQARLTGLTTIAESRFPWAEVLTDISKAIPSDSWLIEITGMVSKDANIGSESGSSSSAKGTGGEASIDVPGPTVKLVGCTFRQRQLASMMTRMHNITGVRQVLLKESKEIIKEDQGGGAASQKQDEECRTKFGIHKFEITLTFSPGPATAIVAARTAMATQATQAAQAGAASGSTKTGDKAKTKAASE